MRPGAWAASAEGWVWGLPGLAGVCPPPRAQRTFLLSISYQGGRFRQPHLRPIGSEPPQFLGLSLPHSNEPLEGRCDEVPLECCPGSCRRHCCWCRTHLCSFLSPFPVQVSYHVTSHAFSDSLAQRGMYRNDGLNTSLEKSRVTGPANFITPRDTLDFHPSYKVGGPSHC